MGQRGWNLHPLGIRTGLGGSPTTAGASAADLESCAEELGEVEQGLERHLDNFDHLVAHYDADEAQRWSEDRSFWLGQWQAAEDQHADFVIVEHLLHPVLHVRLDRLRERLASVGRQIGSSAAGSHDSGEM